MADEDKSNSQAPNFFDKFFIVVTAFGFGLGTVIAFLPKVVALPIVPSIFFGTGIGALVYRFMGGFRQDDSLGAQAIKISGSLASLLGAIVIINHLLDSQLKRYLAENLIAGQVQPNGDVLIEYNGNSLGHLSKEQLNNRGYYAVDDLSIVSALSNLKSTPNGYNHPVLLKLRSDCAKRKGICEPNTHEFSLITHSVKPASLLKRGEAIGCLNSGDDFWIGSEKLIIYKSTQGTARPVLIVKFDECVDEPGQDKKIIISENDANALGIAPGAKLNARFN